MTGDSEPVAVGARVELSDQSITGGGAGWYRRAPTVRETVVCGAEEHVVVWRRGSLAAAHHDLAGEELLVALGADRPACLEVVQSWRAGKVEPARPPGMTFYKLTPQSAPVAHMVRSQPQALPEQLRRVRMITLAARQDAADRDAHSRNSAGRDPVGRTEPLLLERARAALRASSLRRLSLDAVIGADAPDLVEERGRREVVLSNRWLTHVWARQLEVVDGGFTLDAACRAGTDGLTAMRVVLWGDGGLYVTDLRR